jgi:cytochrome c551/c552
MMRNLLFAATLVFGAAVAPVLTGAPQGDARLPSTSLRPGKPSPAVAAPPQAQQTGARPRPAPAAASPDAAFVQQYCVSCHSARLKSGGLALEGLAPSAVAGHTEVWEKVVRKLRTGMMPPDGSPKPTDAARETFTAALEATLDRASDGQSDPGAPALHRLNRTEYANVVRDLLALDVDVNALLPPDDASAGFDNIADVLGVSPGLIEGYVAAAAKISRLALGDPSLGLDRVVYRVPGDFQQDAHVEGMPLGTRGGLVIRHTFPLDAEYDLQVGQAGGGGRLGGGAPTLGPRVDDLYVSIDAVRVPLQGRGPTRLKMAAGPHVIAAAPIIRSRTAGADGVFHIEARTPGITQITIAGPHNPTGPGDTPSRRRILICKPTSAVEETACAGRILTSLATKAYRRPVAPTSPEVQTLLGFYRDARSGGTFESGIQRALARVLVDPNFLFRLEREPANVAAGSAYRIADFDLASRLSFFLWSSIPDDELLDAAARGTLRTPAVLEKQVRRMLADPRSEALVSSFAGQWLFLRELKNVRPDSPEFDGNLRQSMQRETEMLFRAIVAEDRSVVDFLDSDFTFVDERLARHYGLSDVRGSRTRRVTIPADSPRRGLLGHASVLTLTSAANRTSPVVRGKWILDNLMGAPPPNPPPGVETNLEKDPEQVKATSLRQRLEMHRASPQCASCHRLMDPIGLSLENFDHAGKWRTLDGTTPIDASGRLADGTLINGPDALRRALLTRSDVFVTVLAEKLLTYASGRAMRPQDMPAVRGVVRGASSSQYRFSSLILGVVKTPQFQMRTKASRES